MIKLKSLISTFASSSFFFFLIIQKAYSLNWILGCYSFTILSIYIKFTPIKYQVSIQKTDASHALNSSFRLPYFRCSIDLLKIS